LNSTHCVCVVYKMGITSTRTLSGAAPLVGNMRLVAIR
jgi:hypothetical protein